MENSHSHLKAVDPDGTVYDLVPREENLVRLYELLEQLVPRQTLMAALTVAEKHRVEFGHVLRFGCCRDARILGRPHEASRANLSGNSAA